MHKRNIRFILLLSLVLLLVACSVEKKDAATSGVNAAPAVKAESEAQRVLKQCEDRKASSGTVRENNTMYQIVKETYTANDASMDVAINYPQIVHLGNGDRQKQINELIKKEALQFIHTASEKSPLTLPIDCNITWQSDRLLSIQYSGLGYRKGAP
ncbi:MAG: hypothetical protein P4N59_18050 [Negativicutes bacterium]|nr:hypothetical protein [Negativicutes bacterium]